MAALSKTRPAFDGTAADFQNAAASLGEVIALLAGGVQPAPDDRARLAMTMRGLQGFLLQEAEEQRGREAIMAAVLGFEGDLHAAL